MNEVSVSWCACLWRPGTSHCCGTAAPPPLPPQSPFASFTTATITVFEAATAVVGLNFCRVRERGGRENGEREREVEV